MTTRFLSLTLSLLSLAALSACGTTVETLPDGGSDASDASPDVVTCEGSDPSLSCIDSGCPDGQICEEVEGGCAASVCACDDGEWLCTADCGPEYACVPEDPACSSEPPIGETCSAANEGVSCEWGTECCCGDCFASTFCDCTDGVWGCGATDACFIGSCAGRTCESDDDCLGGGEETSCESGICTLHSAGAGFSTGPNISFVTECDDFEGDGYETREVTIDGDNLTVALSYSGGCAEHLFRVCWDGSFMESFPVQVSLDLQHEGNDDGCEAYLDADLVISLTALREAYQAGYATEEGTIIVGIGGSGVDFEFDACTGEDLPACPSECPSDAFARCGEPCDVETDEACGNNIGDSMECLDGAWACTIHAPLGMGCNLVCR
ncbi:MAG: hypothetical protein ACJAYU_002344 [Bradymonadia bacterium]|jgi:hypothetical protein